jgi:ATP-dependent exoDNAse (exonuclease V) alpha subunit
MTLDAVEVDLGASIFEKGQAYTALSRARTLADVRVTDVHLRSLKAHPDVVAFYGGL